MSDSLDKDKDKDKDTNKNTYKDKFKKYKDIKIYYKQYIALTWVLTAFIIGLIYLIKEPKNPMGSQMNMQPFMNMQQPMNMGPPMNMQQNPFMNLPISQMVNMASMMPVPYGKYAKMASKFMGGDCNQTGGDYNQTGGVPFFLLSIGSSILNSLWWLIPILIASKITLYILFFYAPKSKFFAYLIHFASIPFLGLIPFSRIYIGKFKEYITFMYLMPFVGWTVDLFLLFFNQLKPDKGWNN